MTPSANELNDGPERIDWLGVLRDYERNVAGLKAAVCATCGENAMVCAWDSSHPQATL